MTTNWIKIAARSLALALLTIASLTPAAAENNFDTSYLTDSITINTGVGLKARRVDRGINRHKFIFQGETMIGLTASYSSLSANNAEFMLALSGLSGDAIMTTIKPFFGYFYRDNKAIGARFAYTKVEAQLDSGEFDMGSNDINIDFPYLYLDSRTYSYSVFHRTYAPLDKNGHFGVFAEMELYASMGSFSYAYQEDDVAAEEQPEEMIYSRNKSRTIGLSFNPGITAFIMNNTAASLSFEFGGVKYTKIRQYDIADNFTGERDASKMNFRINLFAINFGVTVQLWANR